MRHIEYAACRNEALREAQERGSVSSSTGYVRRISLALSVRPRVNITWFKTCIQTFLHAVIMMEPQSLLRREMERLQCHDTPQKVSFTESTLVRLLNSLASLILFRRGLVLTQHALHKGIYPTNQVSLLTASHQNYIFQQLIGWVWHLCLGEQTTPLCCHWLGCGAVTAAKYEQEAIRCCCSHHPVQ